MTMRMRRCLQATLEDNNMMLCSNLLHSTIDGFFLCDRGGSHHTIHASAEQTVNFALRENFEILGHTIYCREECSKICRMDPRSLQWVGHHLVLFVLGGGSAYQACNCLRGWSQTSSTVGALHE